MVLEPDLTVDNMENRVGFACHASEFWLLSSLILDRISAANGQNQQSQSSQNEKETQPAADGPPEPVLHEYDQTSMRQVNELISVFQNVQIQ